MVTYEEINNLKPLAESRGYSVSTIFCRGTRLAGLEKVVGKRDGRTRSFIDLAGAVAFLESRPELPRFNLRATYTNGEVEGFTFYEVDRHGAMVRGAFDADVMGGLRAEPPWEVKSLEIL